MKRLTMTPASKSRFYEVDFLFGFQKLAAECQSAGHSGVLVPFKCDLSNEEEILSMFAAIKEQHKGVDVCINNAGLAHAEPLLSGKTSGWKNMMDVKTASGIKYNMGVLQD